MSLASECVAQICCESREVLRRHLTPGRPVALLDFPNHQNAGDSMIYIGEREHLHRLGVPIGYLADRHRFDSRELARRVPDGAILLHGGGNLGDRWVGFQDFREAIVDMYRDRKILQLPQSIEFRDPERARRASKIFSKHSDLTLLLRDNEALEVGADLFPTTKREFCPDMAFGMGLQSSLGTNDVDVVALLRRDSERVLDRFDFPAGLTVRVVDWGLDGFDRVEWKVLGVAGATVSRTASAQRFLYGSLEKCYARRARLNIRAASRIIGSGRVVVTDRLHATVLAALMGRPVVALGNANGKIRAAIVDYLGSFPNVRYANSIAEGNDLLASFVESL